MILDSFTNREFYKARKKLEKAAARNRQATIAAMLCVAYDSFHRMQLNRICAQNHMSYQEAERQSAEFSDVFGVDIPTEAFLPNEEKYSDEAIDYYKDYVENCKLLTQIGYTTYDVDAFCKMVFYNPEKYDMCHFRAFNSVGYAISMVSVYDYLCGSCNEVIMTIFEPSGLQPMNEKGIKAFIRTMYKVVDVFSRMVELRAERYEKTRC